jgi:hypothetical protein
MKALTLSGFDHAYEDLDMNTIVNTNADGDHYNSAAALAARAYALECQTNYNHFRRLSRTGRSLPSGVKIFSSH